MTPTEDESNFSFQLKHHQFPVHLPFSITINKAQGQSIERVGIDLWVLVFSHRQLYVTLSHTTNSKNIKILLPEDKEDSQTTNVVYPEVLVDQVSDLPTRLPFAVLTSAFMIEHFRLYKVYDQYTICIALHCTIVKCYP